MLPMKVSSPWMVAAWGASGLARGMASTEYTMSSTKSVRNSAQFWVSPNREYLAINFLRASISASSCWSVIVSSFSVVSRSGGGLGGEVIGVGREVGGEAAVDLDGDA